MRILYVDQYFSNREGISGTRAYEFARRWAAAGHAVTVLACTSHYSNLGHAPQRRLLRRVTIDGVKVVSIRVSYAQRMSVIGRLRSFFSFMLWASVVGVLTARHDVVFASSTPLTVGVPALLISRLRGTPFVFEIRDLWPQAPVEMGALRNPAAIALARWAERLFYRTAESVVALSPGMADGVLAAGTPRERVTMIPNACDIDLFGAADGAGVREQLGLTADDTLVIHAGNLGPSNDGPWLLDVAAAWREAGRDDLHLLLLGEGSDRAALERRVAADGLSHVHFAGPVSRAETARYVAAADIGIVSFADVPVLATNSPNKFFDYLAAGKPALVNTDGWTAELVADTGAGLALGRDTQNAAARIAALADDDPRRVAMGDAARRTAQLFERGRLGDQLLAVLTDASSRRVCALESAAKRLTDITLAALALTVLSPLLLAVALGIMLESRGGALYFQGRIGRDGKPFRLWKFRTMVAGAEQLGDGLNVGDDDARITRVGKRLRDWSLDELPQLVNILLGDMSVVGPRPALAEHVTLYSATQRRRLHVRPGLSGLAQISGRNLLTWDQKLAKDVAYVQTWSWWGDLAIILKTIPVMLRREGLYENDAGHGDRFNEFDDDAH